MERLKRFTKITTLRFGHILPSMLWGPKAETFISYVSNFEVEYGYHYIWSAALSGDMARLLLLMFISGRVQTSFVKITGGFRRTDSVSLIEYTGHSIRPSCPDGSVCIRCRKTLLDSADHSLKTIKEPRLAPRGKSFFLEILNVLQSCDRGQWA